MAAGRRARRLELAASHGFETVVDVDADGGIAKCFVSEDCSLYSIHI